MNSTALASAVAAMAAIILPAHAADDDAITRMALCRDSWVEWTKTEPKTFEKFRDHVVGRFTPHDNDPYWLPKTSVSVLGLNVAQLFPESVGMGVGFSLTVDAPFDKARAVMEKAIGKALQHCETGDDMKTCEFQIATQRTAMVMAEDSPKSHQTLIGCYYFYEK
jgi:hypothetical protein